MILKQLKNIEFITKLSLVINLNFKKYIYFDFLKTSFDSAIASLREASASSVN